MQPRGSLPSDMSDGMVGTNRNGIGGLSNSADPTAALVEVGRWACALMENALASSASLPPGVGRRNIFSRSSVWAHSAPHVLGEDHLEGYPRGHDRRLASGAHHRRRAATLRRRPAPHHGRSAPYGRRPSPRRRHPARPPPSHNFILPADLISVGVALHSAGHRRRRLAHAPVPSPPGPPPSPQDCSSEDGRVFDGSRMSAASCP